MLDPARVIVREDVAKQQGPDKHLHVTPCSGEQGDRRLRSRCEVRTIGHSQDNAQADVDSLVAERGLVAIPPLDPADVIAGQGTLGLELVVG